MGVSQATQSVKSLLGILRPFEGLYILLGQRRVCLGSKSDGLKSERARGQQQDWSLHTCMQGRFCRSACMQQHHAELT